MTNTAASLNIVGIITFKVMLCFSDGKYGTNKQRCVRPEAFQNTITGYCLLSLRHTTTSSQICSKRKSGQQLSLHLESCIVQSTSLYHILWALYGGLCSSQCVWLRRIRCMGVCTMGIQPCVAGGFAGWRQYSSQMQTPMWFISVQNLQKFWFFDRQKLKNKNKNRKPKIWSAHHVLQWKMIRK